MELFFECKACSVEMELSLAELRTANLICPKCGENTPPATLSGLAAAIEGLAEEMAGLRARWRFEVLLETDDLPSPHGFDETYSLPEDDGATGA